MDRSLQLRQMARRLAAAATDKDWHTLAGLDRQLAANLPALAAAGPWTGVERSALDALHAAHLAASRECAAEAEGLARRLAELRETRDGWLAYAMNEDWTEDRA